MAAKSKTLIITICSNTKTREGESRTYDDAGIFPRHLSASRSELLYRTRDSIRTLITGRARVAGTQRLLRDRPYNSTLSDGPDFHPGTRSKGYYLPAAERYRGRFYQNLGPDGPNLLLQTPCHVLIISGLYGLVTAEEPIQCYSCNVTEHASIPKRWSEGDRLTYMLIDYIARNGIAQVVEMTAALAYRQLIAWESVRHAVRGRLFHCFGRQLRGDSLLSALGALARRLLSSGTCELGNIAHDTVMSVPEYGEQVHFLRLPFPTDSGLAAEDWVDPRLQATQVTPLDAIGRMRRNIIRVLNLALGTGDQYVQYGDRVRLAEERCVISCALAQKLRRFGRLRNSIEYRKVVVSDQEWETALSCYGEFKRWMCWHRYDERIEIEDVLWADERP